MLEAFGDPGERSVPSQKRRKGKGDGERGEEDSAGTGESREDDEEVKEKRERGESPGSQESASVDEWSEAEKREEEDEEEEYGEERATSKEDRMIDLGQHTHTQEADLSLRLSPCSTPVTNHWTSRDSHNQIPLSLFLFKHIYLFIHKTTTNLCKFHL